MLLAWITRTFPEWIHVEAHAKDGLDVMVLPDGTEDLHQEIVDGSDVCECLFMALTADTRIDLDNDLARLQDVMDQYAADHMSPAPAPN